MYLDSLVQQIVQSQIQIGLFQEEEQSDQGLHCFGDIHPWYNLFVPSAKLLGVQNVGHLESLSRQASYLMIKLIDALADLWSFKLSISP